MRPAASLATSNTNNLCVNLDRKSIEAKLQMKNSELLLNTGMSERGVWDGVAEEQNAQLTTSNAATGIAATGFRPMTVAPQMTMPASNGTIWRVPPKKNNETTQLAALVRERLSEMGVRQSE